MLAKLGITVWDVLLIGDGSGNGHEFPCGWASVLIDRETRNRKTFYGAMNQGSINLAEMMPYLQGLSWYHNTHGHDRLKIRTPQVVHVVTDSQVTALHGNNTSHGHEQLPKIGHRALWAAMRDLCSVGYRIQYHWAERSHVNMNYLADLIAGLSRRQIMGVDVDELGHTELAARAAAALAAIRICDPLTGEPISPYHINPDGV